MGSIEIPYIKYENARKKGARFGDLRIQVRNKIIWIGKLLTANDDSPTGLSTAAELIGELVVAPRSGQLAVTSATTAGLEG